jgi:hypothetical protein
VPNQWIITKAKADSINSEITSVSSELNYLYSWLTNRLKDSFNYDYEVEDFNNKTVKLVALNEKLSKLQPQAQAVQDDVYKYGTTYHEGVPLVQVFDPLAGVQAPPSAPKAPDYTSIYFFGFFAITYFFLKGAK